MPPPVYPWDNTPPTPITPPLAAAWSNTQPAPIRPKLDRRARELTIEIPASDAEVYVGGTTRSGQDPVFALRDTSGEVTQTIVGFEAVGEATLAEGSLTLESDPDDILTFLVVVAGYETSVTVAGLQSLTTFKLELGESSAGIALALRDLPALYFLRTSGVPLVLDLANVPALYKVDLNGCNLNTEAVDAILLYLSATRAGKTGYIDLTNNAIPSAAGLARKAELVSDGWNVYVDEEGSD